MDTSAMDKMLDDVKDARRQTTPYAPAHPHVWQTMHALAEAHFLPAFDFFVELLQDDDWGWRLDALRCLGFHYRFCHMLPL